MRYENAYVWFVFLSALDLLFTWLVFDRGGYEANALAANVLRHGGLVSLVLFKFAVVVFVILLCEAVGRKSPQAGRTLALAAVGITCVPVAVAILELLPLR